MYIYILLLKGANGTADNGWYKVNTGLYDMSKVQN